MNKSRSFFFAYCFIIANLIIQILGYIDYQGIPAFFWDLSNCVMIMTPLLFGMTAGWICLLPMAVSEVLWFAKLHVLGSLLHLAAFVIVICICGAVFGRIARLPAGRRSLITGALFEAGILAEESIYRTARYLFLPSHTPVTWAGVSGTFLSPANLLILCAGLAYTAFRSVKHTEAGTGLPQQ